MKINVLKTGSVLLLSLMLFSCEHNVTADDVQENPLESSSIQGNRKAKRPPLNTPRYSENELIIQYKSDLAEDEKMAVRNLHEVTDYKVCSMCLEKDIEKWVFSNLTEGIVSKSLGIQSGSGGVEGEILNVDFEFDFNFESESAQWLAGGSSHDYLSKIKTVNNRMTIAVLDTGVNLNFPVFNQPFLYNAAGTNIAGEPSGWDFVNNDSDFYDDHWQVHGSAVSYLINNHLKNWKVKHQILPVKVADASGIASYFDIICGLNYALKRAKIINVSLGWYDDGTGDGMNSIFSTLIERYEERVLIITSAGNANTNNDHIAHYPSNYPQKNIVAVAAANKYQTNSTGFTNYGWHSVDFFAKGERVKFYDMSMTPVSMTGTSYAAPYVSAVAAKLWTRINISYTPQEVVMELDNYGIPVTFDKPVNFDKLIH
jgi:hypothetical protein